MKRSDLEQEIALELEAMQTTVDELLALQLDVVGREPTVREKTAAAAFLAQFYNGVEAILKRISRYHNVPLPTGETWHIDLFQRFRLPAYPGLPTLFDDALALALSPYRRFRHVVFHGYGFQLDWSRMVDGVANVQAVLTQVREAVTEYLES